MIRKQRSMTRNASVGAGCRLDTPATISNTIIHSQTSTEVIHFNENAQLETLATEPVFSNYLIMPFTDFGNTQAERHPHTHRVNDSSTAQWHSVELHTEQPLCFISPPSDSQKSFAHPKLP